MPDRNRRTSVRPPHSAVVRNGTAPLYIPHRSRDVAPENWGDYPQPVKPAWRLLADRRGFRVDRRVRDRYHLALECLECGAHTAVKLANLRDAAVRCGGCADRDRVRTAQEAGLAFLRRDPDNRSYGYFLAPCGHEVRRQFELIRRVRDGKTGIRCATCLVARERDEARTHGWERVGPDPDGNQNYRLYRHPCGHAQRIARINMRYGQCDCARCGESWSSKPSVIYLARISLPGLAGDVVKFGYSATPDKRFKHQLGLPKTARVRFLRRLAMPSGHAACAAEKAANARLARAHPDLVVPHRIYAGLVNVRSEIYWPGLLPVIHAEMDRIARQHPAL